MAKKLVDYAHVAGAAQLMLSEGKRPTAIGIRNILNMGSFTTISSELKKWEEDWAKKRAVEALPIPNEIDEQAKTAARQIYLVAKASIEQLFKDREDALALERAEIDEDIKEAFAKLEAVKEMQEAMAGQVRELEIIKANLVQELADTKASLTEKANQLESAALQLESAQKTIDNYRVQLDSANKELAVTQGNLNSKTEENSANCLKMATLDSELREKNNKNIELTEQLRAETARSGALEVRLKSLEEKVQRDDSEIKSLISEKSNLAGQVKEKAAQIDSLSNRLDNTLETIKKLQQPPVPQEPEKPEPNAN